MARQADLSPPLGLYGGPCLVVERIEGEVRNPKLKHDLSEKVENGHKLTNSEAAKVYTVESERGGGLFRHIRITPHAQYRMDQRGITVGDVRVALNHFSKKLNDWKSQGSYDYTLAARAIQGRETYEWIDEKLGDLVVVFTGYGRGVLDIVTVYWKGIPDPRPATCGLHPRHAGIQPERDFGTQTWVKTDKPTKSDTDDGKYPTRGLPSPPWSKSKPKGPQVFNMPGESGSNSDGTIHKDKVRTPGVPGGQYDGGKTHPTKDYNETGITPNRRPGLTAEGDFQDLWFDEDSLGDREASSYQPQFSSPHPSGSDRQREQKGQAKKYFQKRYNRLRGSILRNVKQRHNRLKHNNRYMNKREKLKEQPERHERRPGGGPSTISERSQQERDEQGSRNDRKRQAFALIPFHHFPSGEYGVIREISPCGFVHFIIQGGRGVAEFETFFDEVILDEVRIKDLFDYMDEVFEWSVSEDEAASDEPVTDALFEAWVEGRLPKLVYAGFQLRRRPRVRQRRQKGRDKVQQRRQYMRNRAKAKLRSRKRYKRLKKNPMFKKQQRIRRKHPERFKRRLGAVLTAPEIAFVFIEDGLPLGYVRNISGMTGLVTFYLGESGSRLLHSEMLADFMRRAVFLSDEDIEAMYDLIDAEIGLEAYDDQLDELDSDLFNLFTIESEFPHEDAGEEDRAGDIDPLLIDPTDDDWFYGVVNKLASEVAGSFFREQRPPEMDPETQFGRATPIDKAREKRQEKRKPGDNFYPYMDEVSDSNPGSRVLPTDKGHVTDKNAALIQDIREGCSPDIIARARGISPQLIRVDSKNAMWLFNVPGSSGSHRVRVQAVRKGNVRDVRKADVKVSCSCPFWQWQGPEFHAKQGDYLYGRPVGTASRPDQKDPKMQHRACKHVLAVLQHVADRKWSIPQVRGKQAALHYLADTMDQGEVIGEVTDSLFKMHRDRLTARYVEHHDTGGA